MKKCTSMLLCLVLLLTMALPVFAAETAHMEAVAVVDQKAATVTVVVSAKQSTANARLVIAFDPDYLHYDTTGTDMAVSSVKEAAGKVTIGLAAASADAVQTGEKLAAVTFRMTGRWNTTDLTVRLESCNGDTMNEKLTLTAEGAGCRFEDVKPEQWFYEAVDAMAAAGYIKGISANRFGPDMNITRADFVTLLGRMDGVAEKPTETGFIDVPADRYYSAHVAWASKNGIALGIGGKSFAPEDQILRYQMVLFLYRYAAYLGQDTSVEDSAILSGYPDAQHLQGETVKAFAWAVKNGIINGMNGMLSPDGTATRAQVAVMLYRFFLEKNL